jgi:hypothetical protein
MRLVIAGDAGCDLYGHGLSHSPRSRPVTHGSGVAGEISSVRRARPNANQVLVQVATPPGLHARRLVDDMPEEQAARWIEAGLRGRWAGHRGGGPRPPPETPSSRAENDEPPPPTARRRPRQCSRSSTFPDIKAHLRIDSTFEDALIAGRYCRLPQSGGPRRLAGSCVLTQTWDWTFDCPAGQYAPMCRCPRSIRHLDYSARIRWRGDRVVTRPYQIDNKSEPGRIAPVYGQSAHGRRA